MAALSWKSYVRAFDPLRELRPDEIDALYQDRPHAAWRRVVDQLEYGDPDVPLRTLLVGSRGAGKTTELVRLQRALSRRYLAIKLDIADQHADGASTLPILMAVAASVANVGQQWGEPKANGGGVVEKTKTALQHLELHAEVIDALVVAAGLVTSVADPVTGAVLQGVGGLKLGTKGVGLLKSLSSKVFGDAQTPETRDRNDRFVDALNGAIASLEELAGRPPVFLIDGLDKKSTLLAVDQALLDVGLLEQLRAPTVLTGPAHLRGDPRFSAGNRGAFFPAILHNLAVVQHTQDRAPNTNALSDLINLADKRRLAADLPVEMFDAGVLERLALASSGYVRDFLRLIDEAGRVCRSRDGTTVSLDDAARAEVDLRVQMQGWVHDEDLRLLRRVLHEGTLPADSRADELLWENLIACYRNDELWYRPHELLIPWLRPRQPDPEES